MKHRRLGDRMPPLHTTSSPWPATMHEEGGGQNLKKLLAICACALPSCQLATACSCNILLLCGLYPGFFFLMLNCEECSTAGVPEGMLGRMLDSEVHLHQIAGRLYLTGRSPWPQHWDSLQYKSRTLSTNTKENQLCKGEIDII